MKIMGMMGNDKNDGNDGNTPIPLTNKGIFYSTSRNNGFKAVSEKLHIFVENVALELSARDR